MRMSIGHLAWSLLFIHKIRNNDVKLLRSDVAQLLIRGQRKNTPFKVIVFFGTFS